MFGMALYDTDLTTAVQRVAAARERLEQQKELVQQLRDAASAAEALL